MTQKHPPVKEVSKEQFHKTSFIFTTILTAMIFAFAILAVLAKQNPYFDFDLKITLTLQAIKHPLFDLYLRFITYLGNPEWSILLLVIISLLIIYFSRKVYAYYFLITVIGMQAIIAAIKILVGRPRPNPELIANQINIQNYFDSFPSGHVTLFVSCFGFLAYLSYTKIKSKTLKIITLSVYTVLISTIGLSRIYLGAHWFSDTLGAYLISAVWLYVMINIFHKRT